MDKKRAAMRQTKAIEAQSERLAAIEQALAQPALIEPAALEPVEPPATAAQIEALELRLAAIEQQITPASDIVNAFNQVRNEVGALRAALAPLIEPAAPADPKKK